MLNRIFIIFLILVLTIIYSVYQKNTLDSQLARNQESILSKLPEGVFYSLNNKAFDPHQLYDERINLLIVHFWGTWCAPCEAELPDLLKFSEKFKNRSDVKFLLIAVNDDRVKVKKHIEKLNYSVETIFWLLDSNNVHRDIYGTTRVPETYVFSSDKVMLRKFLGPQTWSDPEFFQYFQDIMKISSSKL